MKIVIEGKNIELTKPLKEYVNDKLHKLEKHYENIIKGHDVKVKLSVGKNPRIANNNTAEVTIFLNGKIIRSEQTSQDMYASIDLVVDKIDRQIQKYKAKSYRSFQHKSKAYIREELDTLAPINNDNLISKNDKEEKIIKSKKFKMELLTPQEALLQLQLIEHDFYVFVNSKTKQLNVIYKRKHEDFGLIEPIL